MSSSERVNICGVKIDPYSFDEVVEGIVHHIQTSRTPEYVVTPNAQHVLSLQKDPYFQKIYSHARWVVPDGVPLLWAAKLLGTPLKGRVNGTDLFEHLCAAAAQSGFKVFLMGGRPLAAQKASEVLQVRHPTLKVVGTYCPPYGFQNDTAELQRINAAIKAAKPDLLFVGLGAPKQEKWIYEHYQELAIPVSLGIGVSFELVADMVRRAPILLQKLGLEWLFRLVMEPRRLWQRYILGNPQFIWLVLQHKLGLRKFN